MCRCVCLSADATCKNGFSSSLTQTDTRSRLGSKHLCTLSHRTHPIFLAGLLCFVWFATGSQAVQAGL